MQSSKQEFDELKCTTCGGLLMPLLYGMPDYETYHSGRYRIVGCVVDEGLAGAQGWCPECEEYESASELS